MASKSSIKRQKQNINKRKYNKYKYNIIKKFIKNFKIKLNKLDNIKKKKKLSLLFSLLDKNKKIIHFNKRSRIKSKLSNLINKHMAH
ncbi:MAG: 30S ribosomal protein S20 [Candidatus Shikimatogenerans bostrichidophilus]|nr:MAG: 30S ribosomal protein S20 [Candidatus Shikimatogenerans bostrichidophilus]